MVAAAGPACVSPAALAALRLSRFRRRPAAPSAQQTREAPWWLLPPDPETVPGASGPAGSPARPQRPHRLRSPTCLVSRSRLPSLPPAAVRDREPEASGCGRGVAFGCVDPAPDPWLRSKQLGGPEVAQWLYGARPISSAVIPRGTVLFV